MQKDYNLELSFGAGRKDVAVNALLAGETLLRLHPHWFIEGFSREGDRITTDLRDYASEATFRLVYRMDSDRSGLPTLLFDEGPLHAMRFFFQDNVLFARVTSDQDLGRLEEEFGLVLWLRGIREYLRLYLSRSLNTLVFRTLMNRMMLRMNPSQRKICVMIFKITVVEILLILAVIVGFVYFNR